MSGEPVPQDDLPDAGPSSGSAVPQEDLPDQEDNRSLSDKSIGVAGSYARGLAGGIAGLPQTIGKAAETAFNPLAPLQAPIEHALGVQRPQAPPTGPEEPYSPKLSDFVHPEKWQQAAEYFAEKGGLPHPSTPAERIANAAGENTPAGVIGGIPGLISSAAGGAGSQAAKEAGAGPWGQVAAGVAAGSVPGVLGNSGSIMRRLLGGDSAEVSQNRIATGAESQTPLTAGQATGSPVLQKLEAASGAMWGGGPIAKAAQARAESLDNHMSSIVDNLAPPGSAVSPTGAGTAINDGIESTNQTMRKAEKAAYDKVDSLVDPKTLVNVSHSLGVANSLAAPTSHEALNAAVTSSGITKFTSALQEAAQDGELTYDDLSQLRTAVGAKIDRGFAPANPSENGAYKLLYKALSNDKNAGAAAVSPEAADAVTDANTMYNANSAQRKALNQIIRQKAGGPEQLYQAAIGKMKDGATRIGDVMGAIGPDEQNLVRATVLDRMGRAIASRQDETGSAFSPETFLTKWNGMAPEAKDALFGSSGSAGKLRSNLDSFTSTLGTLRKANALQNPSGTGPLVAHAIGVSNIFSDIMIGLFTGHPMALTGMALPLVNNIAARSLTNPAIVKWLAGAAKMPASAMPNAITQLQSMNDPDAQNLANYFTQAAQQRPARASGGKVDVGPMVDKLISRWKQAKKATDESTKPLLHIPDNAIARALEVAGNAI